MEYAEFLSLNNWFGVEDPGILRKFQYFITPAFGEL